MSQCYHCHLPIPDGLTFNVEILGQSREMCCPGCQAVAQAIVAQGMEDYYRYRTEPASKADETDNTVLPDFLLYDEPTLQHEFVADQGNHKQIQLTIDGISCAACAWLIEKTLNNATGVIKVGVNVSAQRATVSWNNEQIQLSEILFKLKHIGYQAFPFTPDKEEALYKQRNKRLLTRLGMAGLLTMQVMMLAAAEYFDIFSNVERDTQFFFNWVSLLLTTPVVIFSASIFYQNAYRSILAKSATMDLPVTLAILGLYLSSVWATITHTGETNYESICMFIFLLLVSRYVEHRAKHQGNIMASNISQHLPVRATLLVDEAEKTVLAKSLSKGDKVLVKAGEAIPADGVVISGNSDIDESLLTGESVAQHKQVGDTVFAGTVNQSGTVSVNVSHSLSNSRINQIMQLQELALSDKPRIAKFTDSIAHYFVLFILLTAASTYIFWAVSGNENALWIAISVLVATCPCALGLATPSAITMAMYHLNKAGWLVKRADVLEVIPSVSRIVFDKTGTLTEGKLSIESQVNLSEYSDDVLNNRVAALESKTLHPISSAFPVTKYLPTRDVKTVPGQGVSGYVNDDWIKVGNRAFMDSTIPSEFESYSIFVEQNGALMGAYRLSDTPRAGLKDCLAQLSTYHLTILSGDQTHRVQTLAQSISVQDYQGECTPDSKLARLSSYQTAGDKVLMVGDGINDGPVLAKADASIAVGSASDIAKQSADLIWLGQQLSTFPDLFKICKINKTKIRQNVAWAIGYNLIALPLAMSGFLSPWMGVIGMSLSSILVVVNSTFFYQIHSGN